MPEIPAKAVCIVKIWQAQCLLDDCSWCGTEQDSYQSANDERLKHLEEHRHA